MSLSQENVAIAADGNVIGFAQQSCACSFVPVAGHAFGADGEEHLALLVELHDGVAAGIRDPDVALGVDVDAVRAVSKNAFAEGAQILPVLIELNDSLGVDSISWPAHNPEVPFRVELEIAGKAHPDAVGKSEPIALHRHVVQGRSLLHNEQLLFIGARSL